MNVFLSYASEERALAERVCRVLETEGHDVFFDRDDLGGGDAFGERIRAAVARAHVLVYLISHAAITPRSYALTELSIATGLSKRRRPAILPVRTDDTPIEAMPAALRAYTILEPQGDSPAEIALAIDRLGQRLRKRRLVGAAAAALAVGAVGLVYLTITSVVPRSPVQAPPTSPAVAGAAAAAPSSTSGTAATATRDPIEELNAAILERTPPDKLVTLMGMPSNDGWSATLVIADRTVSHVHYRFEGQTSFTNTGSTGFSNALTGEPLPNTNVRLPGPFWQRREISVKYTDTKGREHGPFQLDFDPRAQFLRFAKQALGSVSWVTFQDVSPGKPLLYFTTLLAYKAALREIRYSLDSAALDQILPFKVNPAEAWPGRMDEDMLFIPVPPATRFVTVKLVFVDGSMETQRFDANR